MAQNLGDVVILNVLYHNGTSFYEIDGSSIRKIQTFNSNHLIANQEMNITGGIDLWVYVLPPVNVILEAPHIKISPNPSFSYVGQIAIDRGHAVLTFNNSSVNLDNAIYATDKDDIGPISFTGTSSLNITSNTNGKTIIKASTLTGAVSLDVEDGVQDGDTFLIEATNNQLVIIDGEWKATPSTVGNITTYTLAKATLQKPKFRLLYTVG